MSSTTPLQLEAIDREVYLFAFDTFATDAKELAKKFFDGSAPEAWRSFDRLHSNGLLAAPENVNGDSGHRDNWAIQCWESHDDISRKEAEAKFDALLPRPQEAPAGDVNDFDPERIGTYVQTIIDALDALEGADTAALQLAKIGQLHGVGPLLDIGELFAQVAGGRHATALRGSLRLAQDYYPAPESPASPITTIKAKELEVGHGLLVSGDSDSAAFAEVTKVESPTGMVEVHVSGISRQLTLFPEMPVQVYNRRPE